MGEKEKEGGEGERKRERWMREGGREGWERDGSEINIEHCAACVCVYV